MPHAAGALTDPDTAALPLSRRPWDLAMLLLLGAYVAGLALHGPGYEPLVDGWLGALTQVVPAAACWVAVRGAGPRRCEVTLLALAVTDGGRPHARVGGLKAEDAVGEDGLH